MNRGQSAVISAIALAGADGVKPPIPLELPKDQSHGNGFSKGRDKYARRPGMKRRYPTGAVYCHAYRLPDPDNACKHRPRVKARRKKNTPPDPEKQTYRVVCKDLEGPKHERAVYLLGEELSREEALEIQTEARGDSDGKERIWIEQEPILK